MITLDNVIPLLEEVVKIKGEDYTYVSPHGEYAACVYSDTEGNPSCIVGYVLEKDQPEVFAEVVEYESSTPGESFGINEALIPESDDQRWREDDAPKMIVQATPGAIAVLSVAQSVQDAGNTWGDAVQAAKDALEGL